MAYLDIRMDGVLNSRLTFVKVYKLIIVLISKFRPNCNIFEKQKLKRIENFTKVSFLTMKIGPIVTEISSNQKIQRNVDLPIVENHSAVL